MRADLLDVLVVSVGDDQMAIGLSSISAIIRAPVITPLPRAVPPVLGVTVSRGRALTVFTLGGKPPVPGPEQRVLVIGDGRRVTIGLLVDAVNDTRAVARSALVPVAIGALRTAMLGMTQDALPIVDVDALLQGAQAMP